MRFTRNLLIALLITLAVAGCSLKLQVALFNDTGEAITIKMEDIKIAVEPGRFSQFEYPGGEKNWVLHLSTAHCDYTYQVPRTLEHYTSSQDSYGLLKAQVDTNFSIYLLPPSADAALPVTELGALQQDGFPLHPASKNCH